MPAKKRHFASAALKKGFIEIREGNHVFYRYQTSNGQIDDRIHTKVSHGGNGDISDSLLAKMTIQMKFDKKEDLMKYIECTFTLEMYRDLLQSKGFLE